MSLQDELKKWAKNAFDFYQAIDKKVNKGFYTQTPLDRIVSYPEIVVMGINPGSDGEYNNEHSLEKFKQGNKKWSEHREWKYVQRIEDFLRRSLGDAAESVFSSDNRIVYINASCFQTCKAASLDYNLLRESLPLTIQLIEIMKPKLLLCLSAKKFFALEKSFEREYLTDNIILGQFGNIQIVGTPHPSARLSNAKREYIREVISMSMANKHLALNDRVKLIKEKVYLMPNSSFKQMSSQDIKSVFEQLSKDISKLLGTPIFDSNKTKRFKLNDELQFTLTSTGGGYIGVRHILFDSKKVYPNEDYSNSQKYINVLSKFGILQKNGYWLGTKHFRKYGGEVEEVVRSVIEEVVKLLKEC